LALSIRYLFNVTAPSEFYTLSLHDALPIFAAIPFSQTYCFPGCGAKSSAEAEYRTRHLNPSIQSAYCRSDRSRLHREPENRHGKDRKSTRLNSSHVKSSYAVFCLKKKKKIE